MHIPATLLVLLGALAAPSNAFLPGLDFCLCDRIFSPACSVATGAYVATSADCAMVCDGFGYTQTVDCTLLRYYSWRRRCSCSMQMPSGTNGVCYKADEGDGVAGVIASKTEECAVCQKLEGYSSCSDYGTSVSFPDAPEPIDTSGAPEGNGDLDWADLPEEMDGYCSSEMDLLPACSTVTGEYVAESGCKAAQMGYKYTMPCKYLHNTTTSAYFNPSICLDGPDAGNFTGLVAGYAGCLAVIHKCHIFQRRDGVQIQPMCSESPACTEQAEFNACSWPECHAALNDGTAQCSKQKAQRIFDEATGAICQPFGPADYL